MLEPKPSCFVFENGIRCGRPIRTSRGWCEKHYRRWYRWGDPLTNKAPRHGDRRVLGGNTEKAAAEYDTWRAMKQRCCNPKAVNFPRYGGRGITVCERWLHSYENFLADMGRKPTTKHSIDRINNDGPYSPENCRWATRSEQNRNSRHGGPPRDPVTGRFRSH